MLALLSSPHILIYGAYALLGGAAGMLGGLLGVGGGIVVVPTLAWIFQRQGYTAELVMHLAVGTSLASIIVTASAAAWAHHRRGSVLWRVFRALGPGLALGSAAGGLVARGLATHALRRIFAVFLLLASVQLLSGRHPRPQRELPRPFSLMLFGGVIGLISGMLGVGGGTMTVPLLLWCNVPVRDAVGTSAASALPIALAGTLTFVFSGWAQAGRPAGSLGYVLLPALLALAPTILLAVPLGTRLTHALPTSAIKRVFGGSPDGGSRATV